MNFKPWLDPGLSNNATHGARSVVSDVGSFTSERIAQLSQQLGSRLVGLQAEFEFLQTTTVERLPSSLTRLELSNLRQVGP